MMKYYQEARVKAIFECNYKKDDISLTHNDAKIMEGTQMKEEKKDKAEKFLKLPWLVLPK